MRPIDDAPSPCIRVLHVEDNDVNAALVEAVAGHLGGIALDRASSGAQALDRLRGSRPDLLLLDMHLGDMDGFAFLEQARAGRGEPLPLCVAVTADTAPDIEARARAAGVDEVLTKPIRLSDLADVFSRAGRLRHGTGDACSPA